jgi:isoamylase
MILAGDEISNSQGGNNNAYCQDNEISWIDWELTPDKIELVRFVRKVVRIFHEQPVFHRRRFFHGQNLQGADVPELVWLSVTGQPMTEQEWRADFVRCLGVQFTSGAIDVNTDGSAIIADGVLLLFNADHANTVPFVLPPPRIGEPWELLFDTARLEADGHTDEFGAFPLEPCSMAAFLSRLPREDDI